jgi:nucleoside-diphosphate-sugar epimerase
MKVLILGGTGLLGSGLVERLLIHGHEVTATSRGNRPDRLPPEARLESIDRHNHAAMNELIDRVKPDAVVDAIAYTRLDGQESLELLVGKTAHLIMISTDFVYKPSYQHLPITEDAPTRAGTPYSDGKIDCEETLLNQKKLPVTIFRPPHIMGPNGPLGTGSIQNRDRSLIDRMRRGIPIGLIDGGTYVIQPLHVDDAGDAVDAVLGNARCFGKQYNLMSRTAVPTLEYYEIAARELGIMLNTCNVPGDVWLSVFPEAASYVRHRIYDLSRIREDAGWQPRVELDDAIHRTILANIERGDAEPYRENPAEVRLLHAIENRRNNLEELAVRWRDSS